MSIGNISASSRAWLASLPPATRTAWKWDLVTAALAGLYQGCIWTFVLRVARAEMHATGPQMGWIAAAPALGYLFATVWARQMEGRAKLPFCYWTWLIARGLYLVTPFIRTREQFVALVCFTPLLFSVSAPAYTAIMKEIYPDALRGRLMSWVRVVSNVLTLATALVVGRWLDAGLPWQTAFAVGGAIGAASAWAFSRIPLPPQPECDTPRVSTKAFIGDTLDILRRNPGYRWFIASVFVSGFGNLIATTLYPVYQVDRFHVTNTQVANMQNIASVATIAGFFFWGGFLDRRGPLAAVLLSVGLNLAVPLLYAGATDLNLIYLASGINGVAMSGIDLAYLNTILLFAEEGRASQYQALHSSFFGIRGSIAPQAAIPLMAFVGARGAFLASAVVVLAGVWLQMVSMRDYRRRASSQRRAVVDSRERARVD